MHGVTSNECLRSFAIAVELWRIKRLSKQSSPAGYVDLYLLAEVMKAGQFGAGVPPPGCDLKCGDGNLGQQFHLVNKNLSSTKTQVLAGPPDRYSARATFLRDTNKIERGLFTFSEGLLSRDLFQRILEVTIPKKWAEGNAYWKALICFLMQTKLLCFPRE